MSGYVPDPATASSVLAMDELDDLVKSRGRALRDARSAAHFVRRVQLTVNAMRREQTELHRQVSVMAAERSTMGAPTTLDPESAMAFVNPERLHEYVEASLRQKVRMVEGLIADVLAARKLVMFRANAIRLAMLSIADDDSIDPDTKAKVLSYLSAAPAVEDLVDSPDDVVNRAAAGMLTTAPDPDPSPVPPPLPSAPVKPRVVPSSMPSRRFVTVEDDDDLVLSSTGDDSLEGLFDA